MTAKKTKSKVTPIKPKFANFHDRIYDFPDVKESGQKLRTIGNLMYLLDEYGIQVSYDEILKEQTMIIGNEENNTHPDMLANANMCVLSSIIGNNDLPESISNLLPYVFSQNTTNPALDFIKSKEWDGTDRIFDLADTLTVADNDKDYAYVALKTWLIQCVAAADGARHTPNKHAIPKYELVFILQGGQGVKKTSWFQKLLPVDMKKYIIDGVHLDPSKVDSVKQAVSCWICELGELDSTFRRADVSQLKAFLSKQSDTLRLPYDKAASKLGRRVSFCGSVNPEMFLVDATGNRRFLPVQVTACNSLHTIDIQQLWAQVWGLYLEGVQWWCTKELETLLEERHDRHAEINPIHEMIAEVFDIEKVEKSFDSKHYTATRILIECGIKEPKPAQVKFVSGYLKKCGFISIKSSGIWGFWLVKRPFVCD